MLQTDQVLLQRLSVNFALVLPFKAYETYVEPVNRRLERAIN